MRTLVGSLATCVVIVAAAAIPVGAATLTKCKTVATPTGSSGPVYVAGISCTGGRGVAHTFANTGKPKKGWICKAFAYEGGASITCHRAGAAQQRVRFQIAD